MPVGRRSGALDQVHCSAFPFRRLRRQDPHKPPSGREGDRDSGGRRLRHFEVRLASFCRILPQPSSATAPSRREPVRLRHTTLRYVTLREVDRRAGRREQAPALQGEALPPAKTVRHVQFISIYKVQKFLGMPCGRPEGHRQQQRQSPFSARAEKGRTTFSCS